MHESLGSNYNITVDDDVVPTPLGSRDDEIIGKL
jgi:hypothetical protein